jgi:5'-deoxynucleotidase YfbR-like HD superfamily hydrolase
MIIPPTKARIDALMALSDIIYPRIESHDGNELKAKTMLRAGMRIIASTLQGGGSIQEAGLHLQTYLARELADPIHYDGFPAYITILGQLPTTIAASTDTTFDALSDRYADVERATWSTVTSANETNAVHVIHLASLALPYAAQYYPTLSQQKLIVYIWIHDILEAYTGDIPSFGISDAENDLKSHNEHEAFLQLKREFEASFPDLISCIYAYENLVDDESRFVKTFDKIDPGFTHFASEGRQLIKVYDIPDRQTFHDMAVPTTLRIAKYGSAFPLVLEDRMELHHRIGDITWPEE